MSNGQDLGKQMIMADTQGLIPCCPLTAAEEQLLLEAQETFERWCGLVFLEAECRHQGIPMLGPSAVGKKLGVSRTVAQDMLYKLGHPLRPSRRRKKRQAEFIRRP